MVVGRAQEALAAQAAAVTARRLAVDRLAARIQAAAAVADSTRSQVWQAALVS